jgi:hypothetical protein
MATRTTFTRLAHYQTVHLHMYETYELILVFLSHWILFYLSNVENVETLAKFKLIYKHLFYWKKHRSVCKSNTKIHLLLIKFFFSKLANCVDYEKNFAHCTSLGVIFKTNSIAICLAIRSTSVRSGLSRAIKIAFFLH